MRGNAGRRTPAVQISCYDTCVVSEVIHIATFHPGDSVARMLEDMACPACGHRETADAFPSISGDRVRIFCDCCGAFTTIIVSDEQAAALRRQTPARH
jgi:hypothetical protein